MRFGEEGFEGLLPARRLRGWWTLNELGTALVDEELGTRAAPRRRRSRCVVDRVETARGRVDLSPGRVHTRRADGQEEQAQGGRRGRGHQPAGELPLQPAREAGRPASCCRARRSSRCATARCSSRTPTPRCATARSGCATCTSRPTTRARESHEPERPRKLLLHRREIERLIGKTAEKGLTTRPDAHLLHGLARQGRARGGQGKDMHDKRRAIKDREQKREIERALSER